MMTRMQTQTVLAAIALVCGMVAAPVLAAPADQAPIAHEQVGGTLLSVTPQIAYQNVTLRVSGPDGYSLKKQIPAGSPIIADLLAEGDRQSVARDGRAVLAPVTAQVLVDGRYKYEVVFTDATGGVRIHNALFFVENGALVSRETVRARLSDVGQDLGVANNGTAAAVGGPSQEAGTEDDIFTVVDALNDGTTRVGLDSDSPGNSLYWGIDNVGGDLEFREDADFTPPGTARVTFERGGQVGIGTTAPAAQLHIVGGTDIELDGLADFTIDSDTAGDFAISRQGGAQAITIENDVEANGQADNVGIHQVNPEATLHVTDPVAGGNAAIIEAGALQVVRTDGPPANIRFSNANRSYLFTNNQNNQTFAVRDETAGQSPFVIWPAAGANLMNLRSGGIGIERNDPAHPIHHSTNARLTAAGSWVNASSRELKTAIRSLSGESALLALEQLEPVTFAYKALPDEPRVGFIAEDVPELVAEKDRTGLSSMDLVAVLTRVVKDQQAQIAALQSRLEALEDNE